MSEPNTTAAVPGIRPDTTTVGGVTSSGSGDGGAGRSDEDSKDRSGFVGLVASILVAAVVVVLNLDVPKETKLYIGVVGGGLTLVAVLAVAAYAYRKLPRVAGVTNFVVLALVVAAGAIIPVVTLSGPVRIFALKLAAIAFLSLLPGFLFLHFVAVKGKTLWDEYVLNLYRLHADDYSLLPQPPRGSRFFPVWRRAQETLPGLTSTSPRPGLYRSKFEALFGRAPEEDESLGGAPRGEPGREGENLLPVVVHTLLLAVCWTMALRPEVVSGSGSPVLAAFQGEPLVGILPDQPLRFVFAGAYFYILQMLARRYFQDDLKTTAYLNATMRVLITGLLVCALAPAWPSGWRWFPPIAFLIGVFPQLGVQTMRALVAVPLRKLVPTLKRRFPLSALDGMDIWYESRLMEEGIEDMQNLATASIVDVMLRTRIPLDRLIDWIDQAQLLLHLWDDGDDDISKWSSVGALRRHGIRTATDLENVLEGGRRRETHRDSAAAVAAAVAGTATGDAGAPEDAASPAQAAGDESDFDHRWLLNPSSEPPSITLTILAALRDEPNLHHVRCWKGLFDPTRDTTATPA